MNKISVILTTYNVEKYIEQCINSILNQRWDGNIIEDIEILLIDDCSTDGSKDIMNQYSKKFSNIKVYSTESNTGHPAIPRNIGIKKASAEYIMFTAV